MSNWKEMLATYMTKVYSCYSNNNNNNKYKLSSVKKRQMSNRKPS